MDVIAVTNQKGGSGKTTTAVNVAASLAERGRRVLLVDLDPQASASRWLGADELDDRMLEVFEQDASLTELAASTSLDRVDLIPASPNLIDTRVAHTVDSHHALRRALKGLHEYHEVLLDCPPALGHIVISALAAADRALIPVAAHAMELDGLAAIYRTIHAVTRRINPQLERVVLACRVDGRTRLAREVVATLRARLPDDVLREVVRENVRLAEAPSHRQPITVYAPTSAGAEDYRAVAVALAATEAAHA